MKVTARLMVCVLATTTLVALVSALLAIRSDTSRFHVHAEQEAERLGGDMEATMSSLWRETGLEQALQRLQETGIKNYDLQMKWVWFDQPTESEYRPGVSLEQLPQLVPRHAVSIRVQDTSGEHLHTYWPLNMDDRMGGFEFIRSTEELHNSRRHTLIRTAGLIGSTLVLGGAVMWLSGLVFVGRPLGKLTEKTRRIAQGDLSDPLEIHTKDEMGELAHSLNTMCERLQNSQHQILAESSAKIRALEQLQHADRLRTVGRLASGIAHELGTPLNVVSGRAEMIADGQLSPEEVINSAKAIQKESRRMTDLIQQLLDFARRKTPQKSTKDLRQLLSSTANLLQTLAKKRGVEIELEEVGSPCLVQVDAAEIQQVFTNLIMNAIQAMPDGGEVTITILDAEKARTRLPLDDANDYVCVTIRDSGRGIRADHLDHLFEPFFTTKDPGEGTGLGLSISQRIVDEHAGHIAVDSTVGEGTTLSVFLPCGETDAPQNPDRR